MAGGFGEVLLAVGGPGRVKMYLSHGLSRAWTVRAGRWRAGPVKGARPSGVVSPAPPPATWTTSHSARPPHRDPPFLLSEQTLISSRRLREVDVIDTRWARGRSNSQPNRPHHRNRSATDPGPGRQASDFRRPAGYFPSRGGSVPRSSHRRNACLCVQLHSRCRSAPSVTLSTWQGGWSAGKQTPGVAHPSPNPPATAPQPDRPGT